MRTKSGVPYFIFPVFRADDLIGSLFNAVAWCAADYYAHEITARPLQQLGEVFGATLAGGIVVMAAIRGSILLRDANDRRIIERQQREIREETAARLAAEERSRLG